MAATCATSVPHALDLGEGVLEERDGAGSRLRDADGALEVRRFDPWPRSVAHVGPVPSGQRLDERLLAGACQLADRARGADLQAQPVPLRTRVHSGVADLARLLSTPTQRPGLAVTPRLPASGERLCVRLDGVLGGVGHGPFIEDPKARHRCQIERNMFRGCSSIAELQPSKPAVRVRFPSPAMTDRPRSNRTGPSPDSGHESIGRRSLSPGPVLAPGHQSLHRSRGRRESGELLNSNVAKVVHRYLAALLTTRDG